MLLLLACVLAAVAAQGQTLTNLGSVAPTPEANDISQLSTIGNRTGPDGLNYYTDNTPSVGQTFTTGAVAKRLVSLAIKTGGLHSGNGYGTPASTPTFYLRLYAINGNTASPLITLSAPNPGFTDGNWLLWGGLNIPLEANKTYAFSFGNKPTGGGWAAMAVATNAYAGGEIAIVPTNGGTITTGSSHSFDAVFDLGLQPAPASVPDSIPLPVPTYGWNLGNTLEATWGVPNYTAAPFYSAANAGFNAVRIPCAWDFNSDPTTHIINPAFMARVKQAVDWALASGMHVVINDHWDGGWLENNIGATVDPAINAKMESYWTQIATAFAGYDNRLLFAGANEPNVHSRAEMNTLMAYYQTFINAVRGVGGDNSNRWLVLQGGGDTSWLTALPADPTPNRLMVEYHCYSPSQFAILSEDATWGIAQYFWGPAYHYSGDPTRNCVSPEEGAIDSGFQQLTDQYVSKGIPVMVGEFGVAGKPTTGEAAAYSSASSLYWIKYVVDSAHAHGLSPFNWSTPGSIIDWNTGAVTNAGAVTALTGGAAPPPPNGAPYAPSGLTATATNNQIALSWTTGGGATSYNLYRAAESGYESSNAPVVTGITGTSYTDTGLNSGTTYYYQVVAVNSSGPSGFSAEAHATTSGVNPDPTQYHFETDTQRWGSNGTQIAGVATATAQRFAGNQSLAVNFNGTTAGTSSVFVDNVNVLPGTTITFRVWVPSGGKVTVLEPYMSDFNWAWTQSWYGSLTANAWNTLTVTVPTSATTPLKQLGLRMTTSAAWTGTCYVDSISWPIPTAPDAPANLSTAVASGQVTLSWSASSTATSYSIKRSTTNGGVYATVTTTTNLIFTDTGLVNGSTYYYVVSAVNSVGESPDSAQISAIPGDLNARYAFEGNAQDGSGGGQHGTATAVSYVTGKLGAQAAQFNGTSSYVAIPRSIIGDLTVAMWVKTTDTAGSAGAHWWSGKGLVDGEVAGGGADWGTAIVNGKFVLGVGSSGGDTTIASSVNINNGAWHHLAATRDNTTGAMQVYVDGVLRGGGTGATGLRTLPATLRIGGMLPGYNFLNGALDDVRLYSRVLNATEIASLAVGQPAAPQNLNATPATSQITLSWSAVAGASTYKVRRAASASGPYTELPTEIAGTTYVDSGLADGATWYYTMFARGMAGDGLVSSPVSATTYTALENWRWLNFGTIAGSGNAADAADPDGDGWTNQQEFVSGTNPSDPASLLKISQLEVSGSDMVIGFMTTVGITYHVERSYTLEADSWASLPATITGSGEMAYVTDPHGAENTRRFYRIIATR